MKVICIDLQVKINKDLIEIKPVFSNYTARQLFSANKSLVDYLFAQEDVEAIFGLAFSPVKSNIQLSRKIGKQMKKPTKSQLFWNPKKHQFLAAMKSPQFLGGFLVLSVFW